MIRFRLLTSYLVFLVCATVCPAQVIQPDIPRDSEKYSISGVVVNSVTGEPLKRALVELYTQQPRAMLTDAEGQFQFDNLARGAYSVQARKPGYFSEREISRGMRGGAGGQIMLGPDSASITLKLLPEASIAGSVIDADSIPVAHIQVRAMRRQVENGRVRWMPVQQKGTDENGTYRIPGLMPGTYVLAVGPDSALPLEGRLKGKEQGFRETFFASASDLQSAAKIQLNSGQRMEANFSLTAEPFFTVRGTFAGDATGVNVMMMSDSMAGSPNVVGLTVLEGTNRFEAKAVPPGDYRLEATGIDTAGHQVSGSIPLHIGGDVLNARVALQPMVSIPLEVEERHVATKLNVPVGAYVIGSRRNQVGYLNLMNKAGWRGGTSAAIESNGAIPNVVPGTYTLQCNVNPPWYVESATHEGNDLMTDDLVVAPSGEQRPIRFVLRDDGATLRPQLQSSSDNSDQLGTLLVIPDGQPASQIREFPMPGRGETYLPPMKPGGYTLLVIDDISDLEYSNPESLAPYLSRGTHVTLNPEEESRVKLELIHRRSE